jgi:hypothetical protein
MPVILATQEAEIRRIVVQSHLGQTVHKTLSQKKPSQKRAGGVPQGVGLEFKPQYRKEKKKKRPQCDLTLRISSVLTPAPHLKKYSTRSNSTPWLFDYVRGRL